MLPPEEKIRKVEFHLDRLESNEQKIHLERGDPLFVNQSSHGNMCRDTSPITGFVCTREKLMSFLTQLIRDRTLSAVSGGK